MRRLLDDPQLSLELRQDLLRSRAAASDYPAAEKLLQLRAALTNTSRQAGALGSQSAERWAGKTWRLAWQVAHPGWKFMLFGVVAGMGTLVAVQAWDARAPGGAEFLPPLAAVGSDVQPPTAADELVAVPPPVAADELAPEAPPPTAARARGEASASAEAEAAADARPNQAAAPTGMAQNAATSSSSRREIAQLVRIRELLNRDPAAAYRLALRSEREFPAGLLSEERQALAIVALAKTGATEKAKRKAREFLARHPQSPMRELILSAL